MKIAIIGTGYVGLPTAAGFSSFGINAVCVDKIEEKITNLKNCILPIYEPGLEVYVKSGMKEGKLSFTTNLAEAVKDAKVVMLAVGTPTDANTGHADLSYIKAAAKELAPLINSYTVIATKSTVPVGTGDMLTELIRAENPNADFDCVSVPEFLKEGRAIEDFFEPDRIVIGVNTDRAKEVMSDLYAPFLVKEVPMVYCNRRSAEMIKYAANCFLGMKISFINEIADVCEKLKADITDVSKGIGLDSRIGAKFLQPGPGFGGSCFPKDMLELVRTSQEIGAEISLVKQSLSVNASRKEKLARKTVNIIGDGENPVAILGLAFKAETDDVRYSPAFDMAEALLNKNIPVKVHDPKAMDNFKKLLKDDRVQYCEDLYDCIDGCRAIVIVTEWNEFISMDLEKVKSLITNNLIIDYRNLFTPEHMDKLGFSYHCVGR